MIRVGILCLLLSGCYIQNREAHYINGQTTIMTTPESITCVAHYFHLTPPPGYSIDAIWISVTNTTLRLRWPDDSSPHIFIVSASKHTVAIADARQDPVTILRDSRGAFGAVMTINPKDAK